jgi:MerR family transcriptional regulator, copper efflux regulator
VPLSLAELRKTRTALRGLAERAAGMDPSTCVEAGICSIIGSSAAS